MSGAALPYHLRTHKAIERQLFIDLLALLEDGLPIKAKFSHYTYYGFGAAYMEDFRLAQRYLGVRRMFSIERNANSLARQQFNKPASCIRFIPKESRDFVSEYKDYSPVIVWLDYTEPKWAEQLEEAATMARQVAPNSILKITLACRPSALGRPPVGEDGSEGDIRKHRLEKMQQIFGDLMPVDAQLQDVDTKLFPFLMARIVKASMQRVFSPQSDSECLPIALYTYDDGTPMLTVSLLIGLKKKLQRIRKKSRLDDWPFFSRNWDSVISINTPDLTLKERIFITEHLPDSTPEEIQEKLGFHLADTAKESLKVMRNYIKYHHRLPFFLKVIS